ncbi:unnamed protein product [Alopecurus aequalis]
MATTSTKHIVMFPFPGQGHHVSFLEAAQHLLRILPGDVSITLVSTPRNGVALRASTSASSSPLVLSFHALPFVPADHGLPADCESTNSLPPTAYPTFFEAFEALEPAFDAYISRLVAENGPVCVISDVFVAWTVGVAHRRGCTHAVFVSCGALGTAILHALWKNMPALPFADDGLLRLPEHPEVELHRSQMAQVFLSSPSHAVDRPIAFHHRQIKHAYLTDAVLVNTVQELESTGLAMLRRTLGEQVPVCPIGPLPPASVLYISFGSQNSLRPKQMMELATALESTERLFIWAFRPPVGLDPDGGEEWLPAGFGRVRGAASWTVDGRRSLTHGVPIVGWPLSAEQFYNVKMLAEEWGVCVEVARGNLETSAVESCKVAEGIETVMGPEMRRRVADVQGLMKSAWAEDGGSSRAALKEFFAAMRLH